MSGEDFAAAPTTASRRSERKRSRWHKRQRRALRRFAKRPAVQAIGAACLYWALRAVNATQRSAPGSSDHRDRIDAAWPPIVGLWHGQHLLAPFFRPRDKAFVALLSRNADAEMNARVVERFGIETVRGSGGRPSSGGSQRSGKGGARALIALRRLLARGSGVCMIADISKGTTREAGMGIVTLARISGRPILPSAAVTSRRLIIEGTWDKTRVPLPFGRIAVVIGDPIHVPADADEAVMEAKRQAVTQAIEAANRRAVDLAGAAS